MDFASLSGSVWGALGLTSAATTAGAFLLFRFLSEKWLTSKFDERLEAYKHAQQQELEQLRLKINTTFDWNAKLNTHEFEILPKLWELTNEAYYSVQDFASQWQQHSDLNKSPPSELDYVLKNSGLPEYQQIAVRTAADKTETFKKFMFWQKYNAVFEKFSAFDRYAISKTVFLQPSLVDLIEQLRQLMSHALAEKETEERYYDPRPGRWAKCDQFRKEGPEIRNQILSAVKDRLWSSSSV